MFQRRDKESNIVGCGCTHGCTLIRSDQIRSITDYVRLARQIRGVAGPLVTDLLRAGVTVVLDFPANTPQD